MMMELITFVKHAALDVSHVHQLAQLVSHAIPITIELLFLQPKLVIVMLDSMMMELTLCVPVALLHALNV